MLLSNLFALTAAAATAVAAAETYAEFSLMTSVVDGQAASKAKFGDLWLKLYEIGPFQSLIVASANETSDTTLFRSNGNTTFGIYNDKIDGELVLDVYSDSFSSRNRWLPLVAAYEEQSATGKFSIDSTTAFVSFKYDADEAEPAGKKGFVACNSALDETQIFLLRITDATLPCSCARVDLMAMYTS